MSNRQPNHVETCQTSTADILWENDLPISTRFNDVYFSRASGIAESRHVFLEHNHLPRRFRELKPGTTFTIGETGFGTGLNFLCAWQLFLDNAPDNSSLLFISTEKYPLRQDDLKKALNGFEELKPLASKLISAYQFSEGKIDLRFSDSTSGTHVSLHILIGDVLDTLPHINKKIDAWFLDGFAPAKNPDMWQPQLFHTLKAKSRDGATYATFTAARMVRDGLMEAGFSVTKQPGFGRKRDMIAGQLIPASGLPVTKPWFAPADHRDPEQKAIVVGGGLAGCSAAWSLACRGWQVTILEQHQALANEASGNPQGVLYAKLSADNTPLSQFILKGYQFTLDTLKALAIEAWQPCGVIQLAIDAKTDQRNQALNSQHPDSLLQYLTKEQLATIAGLRIHYPGLYFPQAGWVSPPALCHALSGHPNIRVMTNTVVNDIVKREQDWLIKTSDDKLFSKTVIVARGTASHQFAPLNYLPLKAIRGQITLVKATTESRKLASCVCAEGYIAPAIDGDHTLGATFSFTDNGTEIREADHLENLAMQAEYFPAMYQALGGTDAQVTGGRTGFRCTTPDYLPVVGPIVDVKQFVEAYAPLRKNSKLTIDAHPGYLDGLYVTAGHGSRGIISCPVAGEILANMITGGTDDANGLLMPTKLLEAIHPSRFLIRDLIRNNI
ncbi:bifunctional tRNA (5-methylaminomethyl-2-thiouridine)(34)-methyltransferase MnmD/FAD-dependent 5-carboxymethylaminomethyl-2-thiouridine(34) oxidoreductase MnmC [Endozoicomonas sp. SCSIO W0465]|uniref:bifunctional tRNA (5-methylaminomethyl-2-thiouridine)(34)-methyltransferase MnmD/FAD-dependent 5-carboxymethylaminomethyl-2-thiouridine(34) oxidoreductase MnmC n=1 Tax=Endozoicomonas sp. SCSIO W0465 TaxID=2918516 RepID=UPI0020758637|nr:bifunctional tRNA (5-methylaminomethyl-2-thiouridine)(34)-methyltransferase MnmD/FAD-dependent 5-carboxymethylaminomethyl-2-thiouridine(34) oxidoreductase MnmC [Endozoicomonas sp. SCSIO W0465]USE33891.1 bifunctional tRNA (5-methylaminomethyl-2-thiouridine)(34)-methyltransferase MnmD/FAD-dependent 5-carboxymethylaminomethyl-2-thiouridine(34) oxidoreductase MnmC [Endozoicomonas sp. SCSIO W0465]